MITLRHAGSGDLPDLLALLATVDDEEQPSEQVAQACWRRLERMAACTIWLACDDQTVVGTYSLYLLETLGHGGASFAVVESVVVSPERRGQGIGRIMMDHAREQAGMAGCYKLMLSSNRKREAAHRFYERLGFERHGYSFSIATSMAMK